MIYGMSVLEFAFFAGHEILHTKYKTSNGFFPIGLTFWIVLSLFLSFLGFALTVVETIQICGFAKQVFYAEDINEFPSVGEKSVTPSDCMHYFTYHVTQFFDLILEQKFGPKKYQKVEGQNFELEDKGQS
jgi:hypothetical protein